MGRKIFVSYKYSDSNVAMLNGNIFARVRHYVDVLQNLISFGDNIYKGEADGEDLSDFKDSTIESKLRAKIFDSSVTVVMISRGMKELYLSENDQWIPWEISYSLKEMTKAGRVSKTNAILAVVLPDSNNSYDYFMTYNAECNCTNYDTSNVFEIIRRNMFNLKKPATRECNGQTIWLGFYSYFYCVKWNEFIVDVNKYFDIAAQLRENIEDYNIVKNVL